MSIVPPGKCLLIASSPPNMPLDPKTYHPTLEAAVREAYAQNIELTVIPALLRYQSFPDMAAILKWLKDYSEVRSEDCQPCVTAGRECTRHNGSSIRCLACYVTDARECTHQTSKAASIDQCDPTATT